MPQMNPIWWTTLFLIFIISLLLVNSLNYFYKNNSFYKNVNNKNLTKNFNWKW